jgi:branched-chain amino acid transport system substrate-binding protein
MTSKRRPISAIALAVALAAGGAATIGATAGSAKTVNSSKLPSTINLTAVEDMTGPVSYVGKAVVEGLNLALAHINNTSLLGGAKLKLTVLDTASSVSTATTVFSQAVSSNAAAIFGPLLSQEALATAPLAQKAKVVDLAIESQDNGLLPIGNYVWRATASQLRFDNLIPEVVAPEAASNKTVRIIFDSATPSLVQADAELETKFKALGFTVLPNIPLAISGAPTPPNWPAEATALEAGNPGAIGVLVIGANNSEAVEALRNSGYKGILFGEEAATDGQLIPAGAAANGFIYAVDYSPCLAKKYSSSKTFTNIVTRSYPGTTPNGYNATGWDAMYEMATAIADAHSATRAGIEKGLDLEQKSKSGFNGTLGPEHLTGRDTTGPGVAVSWDASTQTQTCVKYGNPKDLIQP